MLTVPVGKTKVEVTENVKTKLGVDIDNLKKGDLGYIDGYIGKWAVIVKLSDGDIVLINDIGYLKAVP